MHHDLAAQLKQSPPGLALAQAAQQFVSRGVLDRALLPWLWRNLRPPVHDDEAQLNFLVQLLEELGLLTAVPGSAHWLLPMRLPDREVSMVTAAARTTFARFLEQMHPVGDPPHLREAIGSIAQAGVISAEELSAGCDVAEAKAKALQDERGADPYGLNSHEIGAINLFTQNVLYAALNDALRSQEQERIAPFWPYIQLLNAALDKLPAAHGTVFRGIKLPGSRMYSEQSLNQLKEQNFPEIWWAFSSTSSSLAAVNEFLGEDERVIFVVEGGSSARDVRVYSHYQQEDELLLPCGAVFAVQTCSCPATKLLLVHVKQSNLSLFSTEEAASAAQLHQHEAISALAESLERVGRDRVDSVTRRYEFHQPLPAGLLAVVLSRCMRHCDERTTVWRRDLVTVMGADGCAELLRASPMGSWTLSALSKYAASVGVRDSELRQAQMDAIDALQPGEEANSKHAMIQATTELIASALQFEVSIGQQAASQIELKGRCHAAQLHFVCLARLKLFERELRAVIREQWPGSSFTVFCVADSPSALGQHAVPLSACEEAAAQQKGSVAHNGVELPLAELAVATGTVDIVQDALHGSASSEPEPEPEAAETHAAAHGVPEGVPPM